MAILIAAEVMSDTAPYRNEQGFGAGVETQWPARSNVEQQGQGRGDKVQGKGEEALLITVPLMMPYRAKVRIEPTVSYVQK